jgi:CheY-like chemotaxis protein/HPt (histidine-containing phosphotransfer) domain-containing protein
MPRKEDVAAQTPGSESQTAPVPLKPLNILIAEDSEDNRLLVKVYLKGSPHRLTFADDGKAAVDLFSVENFDLILMDMQMPIMDGLTATRTIRAIESERGGAAIPIIGLTASALPQDMVLTSRAGCTQHLSKPISKHKLLSTIEGYGPMKNTRDDPPQDGSPQINIEVPPGLEEIVPGYLATRRTELPEMRALLDASDFRRLATLGHDLKGTGASYGFPALTRIGTAVEDSAKQMDAVAISTQLNELADYLVRVQLTNL